MTAQEIIVVVLVAAAVLYVIYRLWLRRTNCCGQKECPAAKRVVDNISRFE